MLNSKTLLSFAGGGGQVVVEGAGQDGLGGGQAGRSQYLEPGGQFSREGVQLARGAVRVDGQYGTERGQFIRGDVQNPVETGTDYKYGRILFCGDMISNPIGSFVQLKKPSTDQVTDKSQLWTF